MRIAFYSTILHYPWGGADTLWTRAAEEAAERGDALWISVAEGVARSASRAYGLPTVIARLGVPYGSVWGWPTRHLEDIAAGRPLVVHPSDPMLFSPIHERDIIDQLAPLVGCATVPATVVNWGGDDAVRLQEWCALMGDLIGAEPVYRTSDRAFRGAPVDAATRTAITGPTRVPWREGMTAMVADWLALRARENGTPA